MGRPSDFTQDLADRICARLAEGLSLRTVCKADDMPSTTSVFNWLRTKPEFLEQYTRAKEESADALSDEMLDIADNALNDWMMQQLGEGVTAYQLNGEHIQRSRLRIETRKWLASKLKPKKYGDKLAVGGAEGLPPFQVQEIGIRAIDAISDRPSPEGK